VHHQNRLETLERDTVTRQSTACESPLAWTGI
jgi:hypothetical protein